MIAANFSCTAVYIPIKVIARNKPKFCASYYQTKPYPSGYSNHELDWVTLEKLSIVRTLRDAPDAIIRFRSVGGWGWFSHCFRSWGHQGSQEVYGSRKHCFPRVNTHRCQARSFA